MCAFAKSTILQSRVRVGKNPRLPTTNEILKFAFDLHFKSQERIDAQRTWRILCVDIHIFILYRIVF